MDVLDTFRWPVHKSGYQIVNRRSGSNPHRAEGWSLGWIEDAEDWSRVILPREPSGMTTDYCPLDRNHTGLFRQFANSPQTDEGILSFANQYGLLGLHFFPGGASPASEDSVSVWKRQIRAMALWTGGPFERSDMQRVCERVSAELTSRVSWRMWMEDETVRVGPSPVSLVGALWLQAGFSLARNAEFRTCICGKPFEVATGGATGKRSDAQFCSDACKSRNFRMIQRVYRMKDARTPIAKIAASVGQDHTWVTAVLRGRHRRAIKRKSK